MVVCSRNQGSCRFQEGHFQGRGVMVTMQRLVLVVVGLYVDYISQLLLIIDEFTVPKNHVSISQ